MTTKPRINVTKEIMEAISLRDDGITTDDVIAYINKKYNVVRRLGGIPKKLSDLCNDHEILALSDAHKRNLQRVYIHPSFKSKYSPSDFMLVLSKKLSPADILLYQLYYALTEGNDEDKQSAIKEYKKYKGIQ